MSDADVRGERTTAVRSVRRRATLVRSVGGRCRVALPPRVRHTPLRDVAAPAQRISTVDPVARTPPAPPARTGIRATRVGGSAAVGAAIFAGIVALNTITLPALLAENLVPLALLTVGCMALVRWFRSGLSNTLRTGVIGKVREFGGGIYGSVAVATWLILEGRDIHGDVVAAGSASAWIRGMSVPWLIGEAIEAVRWSVTAALWPWYWFSELGPVAALYVAGAVWALDLSLRYAPRAWRRASRLWRGRLEAAEG
jgi:hypothetical protein